MDGATGSDNVGDTSTPNPGIYSSMPLKTIAAAMDRLVNANTFTNNETTVYVRGHANGSPIVYNEAVKLSKGGTSWNNAVRIVGYTGATPLNGALPENSNVPLTLATALTRKQVYNRQAVLNGQNTKNIGIDFNGQQYVEVYNFDIINFRITGVQITGSNCKAKSIFLEDIGFDLPSTTGFGDGVLVSYCSNTTLQNVVALNCRRSGIYCQNATYSVGQSCDVYNTIIATGDTHAGTDYYFFMGTGKDCVFQDCKAERGFDATHEGHGFVMQAEANVQEGTELANCPSNDILNCRAVNLGDPILLRGRTCFNTVNGFTATRLDDNHQHNYGSIRLESGPSNNEFRNVRLFNGKRGLLVLGWGTAHNGTNCVNNKFINCLFEAKETAIYGYHSDGTSSVTELRNTNFVACTFQGINPAVSGGTTTSSFQKMDRKPVGNVLTNCVAINFARVMPPDIGEEYHNSDAPYLLPNTAPDGFTYNTCRFLSAGELSESYYIGNLLPGGPSCSILSATPYSHNASYSTAPYYDFNFGSPLWGTGTSPPSGITVGHSHIGYRNVP